MTNLIVIAVIILIVLSAYIIIDNWSFKSETRKFMKKKIKWFEEYVKHEYVPEDLENDSKILKDAIADFYKFEWQRKDFEEKLKKLEIKYEDLEKIVHSKSYARTKKILLHLDSALKELDKITFYKEEI